MPDSRETKTAKQIKVPSNTKYNHYRCAFFCMTQVHQLEKSSTKLALISFNVEMHMTQKIESSITQFLFFYPFFFNCIKCMEERKQSNLPGNPSLCQSRYIQMHSKEIFQISILFIHILIRLKFVKSDIKVLICLLLLPSPHRKLRTSLVAYICMH